MDLGVGVGPALSPRHGGSGSLVICARMGGGLWPMCPLLREGVHRCGFGVRSRHSELWRDLSSLAQIQAAANTPWDAVA